MTYIFVGHIPMPKNAEDVKMMQEKDARIKDLEDKCKKLASNRDWSYTELAEKEENAIWEMLL